MSKRGVTVAIVDVDRDDDPALRAFLSLPDAVYRDDTWYCAVPPETEIARLRREKFRGRQRALVVERNGRAVGRIVARLSPTLVEAGGGAPYGMLGGFEAFDEPDAVAALFQAAVAWLKDSGAETVIGPIDGDTWHRYRLNVGPLGQPPFLMEPYNPPYYSALWEQAGFTPIEHYHSQWVGDLPAAAAGLGRVHRRVLSQGYRWRCCDMRSFAAELRILYELSSAIFAENFLYDPISWDEFSALYEPVRPLLDPELVLFALAPDGREVGFSFAVPDYHAALAAMRGRRSWGAKLGFAWRRRRAEAVNVKSLGVLPAYRHSGVGAALVCEGYRRAHAKGFRRANLCLIRDGNPSARLDGGQGSLLRRYVLYARPVIFSPR
jgi:GNAT superfamily N-acetyltransferase